MDESERILMQLQAQIAAAYGGNGGLALAGAVVVPWSSHPPNHRHALLGLGSPIFICSAMCLSPPPPVCCFHTIPSFRLRLPFTQAPLRLPVCSNFAHTLSVCVCVCVLRCAAVRCCGAVLRRGASTLLHCVLLLILLCFSIAGCVGCVVS